MAFETAVVACNRVTCRLQPFSVPPSSIGYGVTRKLHQLCHSIKAAGYEYILQQSNELFLFSTGKHGPKRKFDGTAHWYRWLFTTAELHLCTWNVKSEYRKRKTNYCIYCKNPEISARSRMRPWPWHAKHHLVDIVIHPLAIFRASSSTVNLNATFTINSRRTAAAFLPKVKAGIGGSAVRQGAEDGSCALFLLRGFDAVAVARRCRFLYFERFVLLCVY